MNCPKCLHELVKHPATAEGIWDCPRCGSRWHILLTSQDDERIRDTRSMTYADLLKSLYGYDVPKNPIDK